MISRNLKTKIEAKAKSAKTRRALTEEAEKLKKEGLTDESIWEQLNTTKTQRSIEEE